MSKLMLAAAGAALVAATTALAAESTDPIFAHDRASWFEIADRNDNNTLSKSEFRDFRLNTATRYGLSHYGDVAVLHPIVDRSFGVIDRDNDAMVSVTEFANAPNLPVAASASASAGADDAAWTGWWEPDYVNVAYYLTSDPRFDADKLDGQKVVNLEGERLGEIERIVRTRDDNRYYAMIDLEGTELFSASRPVAGVPLDDVLLFEKGPSIYISTRGEQFLRSAPAERITNFEEVDTL